MSNDRFSVVHTNNAAGALERRLEMLESRFTTPSHGQPLHRATSSPEVATVVGSSLGGSPATTSQLSFGFDAPSAASRSSNSGGSSNTSSPASNLRKGLVRSKRRRPPSRLSALDLVQLAAERQIQRVIAKSPLQHMDQSNSNQTSSRQHSNTASNQTLLTSHRSSRQESSIQSAKVIAESPPILTTMSPTTCTAPGGTGKNPSAVKPAPVTVDKRKSVPVKRPMPSVTAKPGKGITTPARKRTKLNFTASSDDHGNKSPKALYEVSSNSRSNPGKSFNKKNKVAADAVDTTNIRKIDHFFSAVKKSMSEAAAEKSEGVMQNTHKKQQPDSMGSAGSLAELEALRTRCKELEKSCKDMDGQLKAVSNNQTIMHTALKASLCQREKELEELQESKKKDAVRSSRIIEKLVRVDSTRAGKELRQQLASDGARLGRITHTRAGMRTVENWEEGHALTLLVRRKAVLQTKKQALLERHDTVEKAATALSEGRQVTESIGGLLLNDPLTIVEAQESVRLHLDELAKDEKVLLEEDKTLKNEKAEHIRALKLVASEDASRFRSRPKLNDRYVLLSLLGKGGFSEVWRAFDLSMLREVAVKIHQLDTRWSEAKKDNYTKHVSREYEIHRDVRHPRIVSLYDVFEIDNNSFATVLECCKGTDLDSLLKERKCLPERDARAILLQILSGMNYLSHSSGSRQGIIHYDLKPGNILFDEFGDAKITDFGLSKIVDAPDAAESMELTSQGAGTYWYLPPECFVTSQAVRISNKVDVWSIGVIYYQMLFGKRPFGDGMSQDRVLSDNTMLNAREVRFPTSMKVSPEAKQFIQQCLTYDQTFRPTVGQVCKSSYLLHKKF